MTFTSIGDEWTGWRPSHPFPLRCGAGTAPTSGHRLPRDSSSEILNREARHITQAERKGSGAIVTRSCPGARDEEPVCRTPHAGRGPKITLLVDRGEVMGFSCLLLCKAIPPTCSSVLLSPFSSKEKQEQILHDNTVSQARSLPIPALLYKSRSWRWAGVWVSP